MRRKALLLPALAVAFIGGAWWWVHPPEDPIYRGRRLSDWVHTAWQQRGSVESQFTVRDCRAIGPKAAIWLGWAAEHGQAVQANDPHAKQPTKLAATVQRLQRKWFGPRFEPDYDERIRALGFLRNLGPDAAPAIPALQRLLTHSNQGFACIAAHSLVYIGAEAHPAVEKAFREGGDHVRMCILAACQLASRDDSSVSREDFAWIEEFEVKALQHPDEDVRFTAAMDLTGPSFLARRKPAHEAALPVLIAFLSDPGSRFHLRVAGLLPAFGRKAAAAIPGLIGLLDSTDPKTRAAAAAALGRIDVVEKQSQDRLRQLANDPDAAVASEARKALGLMEVGVAL